MWPAGGADRLPERGGLADDLVALEDEHREQFVEVRIVRLVGRVVAPEFVFPVGVAIAGLELAERRDREAGMLLQGEPRPVIPVVTALAEPAEALAAVGVDRAMRDEKTAPEVSPSR